MLYSEHSKAFRSWHVAHLDHTSLLWREPPLTSDAVRPQLRKFADQLKLCVERDAVSVAAEWDYELWDVPFVVQARVTRHDGFFACEHAPDDRVAPIESLWGHWLYDPLLSWAGQTLMPARVLYFCRRNETRWVRLFNDVTRPPADAVYAVFDHPDG